MGMTRDLLSPWWRAVLIGAGALALGLALLSLVRIFLRPLAFLFLAVVLGEALEPLVGWLERWLPRLVAIIVVYLVILLIIGVIVWRAIPPLITQAQAAVMRLPEWVDRLQDLVAQWNGLSGGRLIDAILSQMDRVTQGVALLPLAIISSTAEFAVVVVMSMYWLIVSPTLQRFVLSLLPPGRHSETGALLRDIGRNMGGYVRGLMIDAMILGAAAYVGLLFIQVRFHLVLAGVAALGGLIPIVGSTLAGAAMVGVALTQSLAKGAIVFIFYLILQFIENNILLPNIIHRQAYISPFLVIFALFAGAAVGGILGALVAIPLSATLRVIVLQVIVPLIRRWSRATAPDEAADQVGT